MPDKAEAPSQHPYARIIGVKKRCRKTTKTLDRGVYSDAGTFSEAEIAAYVDDVTHHAKDTHKSAKVEVLCVSGVTSVLDGVRMFKAALCGSTVVVGLTRF